MARRARRNHSPAHKAKGPVAAIKDEKSLVELAQDFDLYPTQIEHWRDRLLEGATGVLGGTAKAEAAFPQVVGSFAAGQTLRYGKGTSGAGHLPTTSVSLGTLGEPMRALERFMD